MYQKRQVADDTLPERDHAYGFDLCGFDIIAEYRGTTGRGLYWFAGCARRGRAERDCRVYDDGERAFAVIGEGPSVN